MAAFVIDQPTTGPLVTRRSGAGTSNTASGRGIQLTVSVPVAPVYADTVRAVRQLAQLPRGWDGHDGRPPRPDAIAEATAFLSDLATFYRGIIPAPLVGPSADGGVALVWRRADAEVELLFAGAGTAEFALTDRDGIRPMECRGELGRHDLLAIARAHLIA